MLTDKIKRLAATKSKVAELEATIAAELTAELAALPSRYGFESVEAFLQAVRVASQKRRGPKSRATKPAPRKKRQRAKITDEVRAEVKKLAEAGKSGKAIAKAVGISLPSVQNVKKQIGLVGKK